MKKFIGFIKKNLKWIIALIALILFIAILRNVYKDNITSFDDFYYEHISGLISNQVTSFVKIITNLGGAFALIFITGLFLAIPKNKRYGILICVNLVSVFVLNLILKLIFARPRPIDINIIEEIGYSFPSAHAMVSTAFYGFIIYLIWQSKKSIKQKWIYSILLSLVILLICVTRIYLGVHYASDVFAGMLISISYLILFTSIISKYLPQKEKSSI